MSVACVRAHNASANMEQLKGRDISLALVYSIFRKLDRNCETFYAGYIMYLVYSTLVLILGSPRHPLFSARIMYVFVLYNTVLMCVFHVYNTIIMCVCVVYDTVYCMYICMYFCCKMRELERPMDVPDHGMICDLLWSDPDEVHAHIT
jgi:hypothetical protein